MATVARFEGAEDVVRELESFSRRVLNKYEREGLMAAAEIVRADASSRAPRRTGHLAANMLAEWVPYKRYAIVGPAKSAFYGEYQEFGTRRATARPFLRPALDANETAVRDAIAGALEKAVTSRS